MKYRQIEGLEEDKFRRLTGVKRTTFARMVAILTDENINKKAKGSRKKKPWHHHKKIGGFEPMDLSKNNLKFKQ